MKYIEFKKLVRDIPVFSTPQLSLLTKEKQVFRNQISRWKRQGLIIPLKKGLYVLNELDRKINLSREFIANQLVFPSYLSLEYALFFYGFIPERVFQVTSVTSKKTTEFVNSWGTFIYRNLKSELFFGYTNLQDENGLQMLMAEKEKAFLDLLYLNLSQIESNNLDFLEESYRFENLDELNKSVLLNYAERFHSKKLSRLIQRMRVTEK